MKRNLVIILALTVITAFQLDAQVGKFLKNVAGNVKKDLLGTPDNSSQNQPEPNSACTNGELVFEVGKYKADYSELNINVLNDGSIVVQDRLTNKYYIAKAGVTEGPLKENDLRIRQYEVFDQEGGDDVLLKYRDYIKRQGDKYVINFAGKTYGPYARIDRFAVTRSGDKFAASVVETIVATEDEAKAMQAAMDKAKTEQEQMELAMKYSQQIQEKLLQGGGPNSIMPKIVSNLPVGDQANFSMAIGIFNATMKYDDILVTGETAIIDLQGKTVFSLPIGSYDPDNTFISSDNTKYAKYDYGTLTFSDGKKLNDLFNPLVLKYDGKIYLSYMYFSPKKNAIMQCRLPF